MIECYFCDATLPVLKAEEGEKAGWVWQAHATKSELVMYVCPACARRNLLKRRDGKWWVNQQYPTGSS